MSKLSDGIGKVFGDWKVVGIANSRKWACVCEICGMEKDIDRYSLEHGASLTCKHEKEDTAVIEQKIFGEWEVIGHGKSSGKLLCKCSCGTVREVSKSRLLEGRTLSCGHTQNRVKPGDIIEDYEIIKRIKGDKYLCRCIHCNKEVEKYRAKLFDAQLNYNKCQDCHPPIKKPDEFIGKQFGEWSVLSRDTTGKYLCRCSCGTERLLTGYQLRTGTSKSCGHATTGLKQISGQTFGYLTVLEYAGNRKWLCKCVCGNTKVVDGVTLHSRKDISCGCKTLEKILKTRLERYGETCLTKQDKPREQWQIDVIQSKESFEAYIKGLGCKPYTAELSRLLGINNSNILKRLHKYNLEDLVEIETGSFQEKEMIEFIQSQTKHEIRIRDRKLLGNQELDVYIPDICTAFEFNGNYWHSSLIKDRDYHQKKTIACAKLGVRLIHIFEYEWQNDTDKIKSFISDILAGDKDRSREVIYGRNTFIKEISSKESEEFLELYHLQGAVQSLVKLGCFNKDSGSLLGVMTFGKPRFNQDYDYEIIRLAWKSSLRVVGGTEKLLQYFLKRYSPNSIITYVDISKFTGNIYTKLNFKPIKDPITLPNYVWVRHQGDIVLSRYQTQKYKLVNLGYGTYDMSEDEIMTDLDFYKIYNSGNLRLEWRKN